MKLNLEHSVLVGKLGSVLGREFNVYVKFVAALVADNLLFKTGNE